MEEYIDIEPYFSLLEDYFREKGLGEIMSHYFSLILHIVILVIVIFFLNYIIRRFVIEGFKAFTNRTKATFDDFLIKSNFPKYVGQIFPIYIIYVTVPFILEDHQFTLTAVMYFLKIYIIVLVVWIFRSLLRSTNNYLKTREEFLDKPLDSYIQVLMIFIWVVGFMFIFNLLTGGSAIEFILSLGAASAILLLIFKDTILGFVASIQISVNDIVRIGDWITFSKFGADGSVTEINLATVKVQNWDNTYTTIPTYSLIADSFQNWRGMQESPGRRIKRSIFIKQNSVKFIGPEDLEYLKQITLIEPYLEHRQKEIDSYNSRNNINKTLLINGRNQTNLGVFRKYVESYLSEHPAIHKEMYLIVRHQAPTPQGIPLEILCFSKDKRWANFEYISSDIFDHIIAALPFFGLILFESPSGDDFNKIKFEKEN